MLLWMTLVACVDDLQQVAGTGSIYTTRCTAEMEVKGVEFEAACTPPTCIQGYTDAAVSHTAMVIDPGKRVIGVAERACVQDLSNAAALFQSPDEQKVEEKP